MVSPVWYNIRRIDTGMYDLSGEHDVDISWMEDVRAHDSRNERVGRILPRFAVEAWDKAAYQELMDNKEAGEEITRIIVQQIMYSPLHDPVDLENMTLMGLLWKWLFLSISRDFYLIFLILFTHYREINELSLLFPLQYLDIPVQRSSNVEILLIVESI